MTKNQNTGAAGGPFPTHVQRDISAKMQQAGMLLQTGRLAQADYACQEVLKKNSAEPQAWYYRGVIAYKAKKYTEAVGFLQEALRLAPALLHKPNSARDTPHPRRSYATAGTATVVGHPSCVNRLSKATRTCNSVT